MKKVLLLSMPMGALERPSLGLSLLKARLNELGVECDVRYLTFAFAEFIGQGNYQWMCYELPYTAFAGDWSFTQALYGDQPEVEQEYIQKILREVWQLSDEDIRRILYIRSMVPHFLDHCLAAVSWRDYAIVGFTSTFEQNIASLALAKRIKQAYPKISIVFGGANWEAGMGQELHRQFSFVDYVCSGEAEESFPALVRRIFARTPMNGSRAPIPGIVYRDRKRESVSTGSADLIREMDALPVPDFSNYFHDLAQCTVSAPVAPTLLFETSRGCWWGAKSHCTFCGLNGGTMAFRSKSPRRALDELEQLVDRWQLPNVEAVDNILDMKYFSDMLPALAHARRPLQIFYEVKSNLSRAQVKTLSEAGVNRIQPGIESLSDHVLKLMRKGTTALRNIQLLKWAQEFNILVEWNILYGFPGETPEDYRRVLEYLPAIRFLRPPCAAGPIRLDRFSPYHNSSAEFGLVNVRPLSTYRYLYPFAKDSLERIAYYFDFDYEPEGDPTGYAAKVVEYVYEWKSNPELGTLRSIVRADGSLVLLDTRSDATIRELLLTGLEQAAYEFCDELRAGPSIVRHLHASFPLVEFSDSQVLDFLESLVQNRLMVTDGVNYLSLAIRTQPIEVEARRDEPITFGPGPLRSASSYLRAELKVLQA
ncbi:MAG TPA: RiPP maturation radical SAM C-methyltransferase [Pyrinomonadaceae bacterium]|nr:RiPP maturation radical SAM C-methyltransferase [Pyrinomonadaceae bacterium]